MGRGTETEQGVVSLVIVPFYVIGFSFVSFRSPSLFLISELRQSHHESPLLMKPFIILGADH